MGLRRRIPEIPAWIFMGRSAATRRTNRKVIRKPSWRAKARAGGEVELQRKSAGGESQRINCEQPRLGSHRHGRALRRAGDAGGGSRNGARSGGRRQR